MYFELNVSHNGSHLFATAPRSLKTREAVAHCLTKFDIAFPEAEGYVVTLTRYEESGEILDLAPYRALAAAIDFASGS